MEEERGEEYAVEESGLLPSRRTYFVDNTKARYHHRVMRHQEHR